MFLKTRSKGLTRPQASEGDGEAINIDSRGHMAHTNVLSPVSTEGVCQVVSKVIKGALAGGLGLKSESSKSNHGKAAVLDFLNLGLLEVTLGEAQGVEDTSGISRLGVGDRVVLEDGVIIHRAVVFNVLPAANLDKVHEKELPSEHTTEVELATTGGQIREVLRETRSVPPLLRVDDFLAEDTSNAKHGPAAVNDLSLTHPSQGLGGRCKTHGIKSAVT